MKKEISEFDIFKFLETARIDFKRHIIASLVGGLILFIYSLTLTPMFKISMDVMPADQPSFTQSIAPSFLGIQDNQAKEMIIFETIMGSSEMSDVLLSDPIAISQLDKVVNLDTSSSFLGSIKNIILYKGQVFQSPLKKLSAFVSGFARIEPLGNGVYRISSDSSNPQRDAKVLRMLVMSADQIARKREIVRSTKKVEYLKKKIQSTSVNEYQESLIQILAEEEKSLLVAEVNTPYSFDILQDVAFGNKPFSPNVIFLIFTGIFIGMSASILWSFIRK